MVLASLFNIIQLRMARIKETQNVICLTDVAIPYLLSLLLLEP